MNQDIAAAAKLIREQYFAMLPAARKNRDEVWAQDWEKTRRSLDTAINGARRRVLRGSPTEEDKRDQNRERQQHWRQRERERKESVRTEAAAKRKAWQESPEGQAQMAKDRAYRASLATRLGR